MNALSIDAGFLTTVPEMSFRVVPASPKSGKARSLFQNQSVSIVLTDLKEGQRLEFDQQTLALLVVIRGRLRLHGPDGSFVLQALGQWKMNRNESWKVRALSDSTAALFIVNPTTGTSDIG